MESEGPNDTLRMSKMISICTFAHARMQFLLDAAHIYLGCDFFFIIFRYPSDTCGSVFFFFFFFFFFCFFFSIVNSCLATFVLQNNDRSHTDEQHESVQLMELKEVCDYTALLRTLLPCNYVSKSNTYGN